MVRLRLRMLSRRPANPLLKPYNQSLTSVSRAQALGLSLALHLQPETHYHLRTPTPPAYPPALMDWNSSPSNGINCTPNGDYSPRTAPLVTPIDTVPQPTGKTYVLPPSWLNPIPPSVQPSKREAGAPSTPSPISPDLVPPLYRYVRLVAKYHLNCPNQPLPCIPIPLP